MQSLGKAGDPRKAMTVASFYDEDTIYAYTRVPLYVPYIDYLFNVDVRSK